MYSVPSAAYAFAFLFMAALDGVWIGSTRKMYNNATAAIQKQPMETHCPSVLLSYGFLYGGIALLALPSVYAHITETSTPTEIFVQCLRYGGVLGAAMYGVYNFTNKALLTNYPWSVAVLDTTWGTVMTTLATFFAVMSTRAIKSKKNT